MNLFRKNNELESLKQSFESVSNELQELEVKFQALQQEAQNYKEANYILQEEVNALKTEVVEVETEIAETVQDIVKVDELASHKALEILASVGTEPVEIIEEEETNYVSEFKKLKGKDLQEFYNKHKAEIKKALKNK